MQSFHTHPLGAPGWIARAIQCASAIVVLGITAWAVRDTKTVTVIYSVTIAALTVVILAVATTVSCITRQRKWHILPLIATDMVLSYLWLTSFIFLADDFNRVSCRTNLWNGLTVCSRKYTTEAFAFIAFFTSLMALIFEICYIYYAKPKAMQPMGEGRPEERIARNLNQAGL
ncbi:hypothetical protein NUU61_005749, partial [Penicillium alfredii]